MTGENDGATDRMSEVRSRQGEDAASLRQLIEDSYFTLEVQSGFPHHRAADPDDESIAGDARRAFDQYDADQASRLNQLDTENAVRQRHAGLKKEMGAGAADYTDATLRGIDAVRNNPRAAADYLDYHNDADFRSEVDAERAAQMEDAVEDYFLAAGVDAQMEEAIFDYLKSGLVKIDPRDPVGTLRRAHQLALQEIR
jgi:hypothetical protein